jgi:hypothetical protein
LYGSIDEPFSKWSELAKKREKKNSQYLNETGGVHAHTKI